MPTRRSALRLAAAAGFLPALPAPAAPKATAFALVGDRYHNPDYIRTALRKTLVKDLGVSIDFTDEVAALNARSLSGYRLLILFRDGMLWPDGYPDPGTYPGYVQGRTRIVSDPPVPERERKSVPWITPEQGRAVKEFASRGGGILFYHNVTYISPDNDDFRDVLGAVTQGHPPMRPFRVKVVNAGHPITRGVRDFLVTDEQHFLIYQKDPKHVLLRSVNEDGLTYRNLGASCEAGWAYDYGKGRICYLAPGHMIVNLWNPEYEKLQQNAVRWLLRQS
ncbi:MAG: ThuA domain-containing protein [Bryobacterales bacterium]|nr:ThuA domain-containing protein [Bryobacterales bacterium]